MRIAIIGAGIAGLSAAYDLVRAGHHIVVYEAAQQAGGLASGFRDARWDWPLERFYHHIFTTDHDIIKLVDETGFRKHMLFRSPVSGQWWNGRAYALDGVLPILRFPGLPFPDRLRFGMAGAYLKFATNNWRKLEQTTADQWTRRWAGTAAYKTVWRPMLEGKFGPYVDQVNMAWLWARLKTRSFKLGYFEGGFQAMADHLVSVVSKLGVRVKLSTPISLLEQIPTGGWYINTVQGQQEHFDAVIVTGSPAMLSKLAPRLPESYLGTLMQLRSMGAVVMTIALKQSLTGGIYWINMLKSEFPFLSLVEHTNFISPEHYGGDHLIYCGDYLEPSHEYFQLSKEELLGRFIPALSRVNPAFDPGWIRDSWLHREPYAQPIVTVGHSANIPPFNTPLTGLYWASMSQVYPWDRGTNFAVELGRKVAQEVMQRVG